MGKESLTKSTTKKKTATKKKEDTQKKAAGKKTAPKKTAAKKTKAAPKAKATPKTKATTAKKAAAPKKVSRRDLLSRKFEHAAPTALYAPPAPTGEPVAPAPPFYTSDDENEVRRVRALLFQQYRMEDLKIAAQRRAEAEAKAKAKAEEEARAKAEAEAKARAEEQARAKAEAEAKARAEEEARAKAEEEARIKADAEKAVKERAAAREAAEADEPKMTVQYDEPPTATSEGGEPVDRTGRLMAMGLAGGVALLLLLVIGASLANTGKYYLRPTNDGLEIWRGKFAPIGVCRVLTLPGVAGPERLAPQYRRTEVMPLAVDYYLSRADTLLAGGGVPDFEAVKAELDTALDYASSRAETDRINARIDGIDKAVLLYKAQVAAASQNVEGYEAAVAAYREAARLTDDPIELEAIEARISVIEKAAADLKLRQAEEAAAQEAATE